MKCPICNKEINRMYGHLGRIKDDKHQKLYIEQIKIVNELFYNLDFESKSNLNDFNCLIPYSSCLKIWQEKYGKDKCKERANKLNSKNVSKKLKGIPKSEEHRENLSKSHIGQKAWNKGLTAETNDIVKRYTEKMIKTMARTRTGNSGYSHNGYRRDIGHEAASTYEANIYRILQYEKKNYKYEYSNIFWVTMPNGKKLSYRIDILDIDGFFGEKGAYIEVKGYLHEKSKLKISAFKEQYPEKRLLIIGPNTKKVNYIPDIDYLLLEEKYKHLIPLWEDGKQNLKKTPELYK